jgi:hypothetical protein
MDYSGCTNNDCRKLRLCSLLHDERQRWELKNGSFAHVAHWAIHRTLLGDSNCPPLWLYRSYWCSSGNKLSSLYYKQQPKANRGSTPRFFYHLHPINSDVKTKPDNVNEVPVPSSTFKRKMILGSKVTTNHATQYDRQHQATKKYVKTMETGQHKEG